MKNFLLCTAGTLLVLPGLAGAARRAPAAPAAVVALTGYVFEDPNYGGGTGRPRSASGASLRPGVTVELYNADGSFAATTTTDAGGQYSFSVNSDATYQVRVVNATVGSGRSGATASLRAVQTYAGLATDANAGNRVGGAAPQLTDAGANTAQAPLSTLTTGTTTPESVATVSVGGTSATGPDFGFSFDVVVNTNDAGQGSLRQFVLNANALGDEAALAQAGSSRSTTGSTTTLAAGREASIFMIPDGQAHPGLLATDAGGPASALTAQNGQQVAVITLSVAGTSLAITGANAGLTTVDGGTQTYNIGNTNAAVLSTGGTVGTTGSFSYTSFSGPEVQLLGEYVAANAAGSRKPRNGFNVLADDFTLRNVAMRNFGNPGGQGAVGFDNVPGRTGALDGYSGGTGPLGPVRALLENDVFGSDASSFTAPTPFASNEGDNGRSNQHVQYDISGTTYEENTVTVRTSLLGFSERRAIHFQGNSAITGGYNLNVAVYDNLFQEGGVGGNPLSITAPISPAAPYMTSSAGAIELIQSTRPFLAVYQNQIVGPGDVSLYNGNGSDGIELNNARVNAGQDAQSLLNNERRDAGTARTGSRVEQNTIRNMRLGMLCQSNIDYSSLALDGLRIAGNYIYNSALAGFYNQGDSHQLVGNAFLYNYEQGLYTIGSGTVLQNNVIRQNSKNGLIVGDAVGVPTSATHPATTGVVVGPGNLIETNGTVGTDGQGILVVKADTRVRITQNSQYANRQLAIDLAANGITANNGTLNQGFPNQELDYPVLLGASLVNGQLTVRGYVGSAAGQSTFAGAVVELFVADNTPADQSGELVAGDGQSVPHGEGRTYLGTLTADGSGNLSGTLAVSGLAAGDFITATATLGTDAQASTSEFGNNVVVTDQPLPVQLVAFTAQAAGPHDALLSWTTASELHNDRFEVERSLDGTGFAKVGQVAGQGSKAGSTRYTYPDLGAGAAGGTVYYRLRQVDTDGSSSYSPVRAVRFGAAAVTFYPNPAQQTATLDLSALPATASCQALLLDATGRQVRRFDLPGGSPQPLDLRALAAGLYQLQLRATLADSSVTRQTLRVQVR